MGYGPGAGVSSAPFRPFLLRLPMRRAVVLACLPLLALAARAQTPIPIADAKAQAVGTVVTVAGRVTVANEFGGPAYFQDATGGMPVFLAALHAAVQEGDSVVVTGPLSEFQPTAGQPGTGLKQISGTGTTYAIAATQGTPVLPRVVTLADLDEPLEGQLLTVSGVRFATTGTFQAGMSYPLTDGTTTVQVFVDNNTNLVGAAIPAGAFRIVGVLGQFRGTRQLQPRRVADVGATPFEYPAESTPRSQTFEVATWNIAFFGYDGPIGNDPDAGPNDEALQLQNAARVLRALDADLVGLQEIVSTRAFRALVDSLNAPAPGAWRGFIAPIRQVASGDDPAEVGQKTAFVYRTATVDSVSAGFLTTSGQWAYCCGSGGGGRYPFRFTFDATVGGVTRRISAVVIHAKAGSTLDDYSERMNDAVVLKQALDARADEALVLLGDYNDDVDVSTVGNRVSPYAPFVNDPARWRVLTRSLSDRRFASTGGGEMIDHIAVSNELVPFWISGTERLENPSYVGSYLSTTSDHYPVWVRLNLGGVVAAEPAPVPGRALGVPAPNPARGALRVAVAPATPGTLAVFDALGRKVAAQAVNAGAASVTLGTDGWAPGVYVVRLDAAGVVETRTVVVAR